jgi:hypothetical protein
MANRTDVEAANIHGTNPQVSGVAVARLRVAAPAQQLPAPLALITTCDAREWRARRQHTRRTNSAAASVAPSCTDTHASARANPPHPTRTLRTQNLIEKITRNKIYSSVYWKKECFGLSAADIVDKAVLLRCVGGMMGEPQKPTEFICLILKMLQIQPSRDIVIELIKNDHYKYVRLLGECASRVWRCQAHGGGGGVGGGPGGEGEGC